ncbi:MAG: thioredoxin [Proteobacteria bacterium]|uniref:thioredoxin n=1 Tax=Solilutibacter silvestris TaxID=1645665 RepID=UPI001DF72CFA|nr:thioredoxin [Pseudomonadota bacterium]MBS0226811.1 thioredoxin [Pseudomonadota bacterium]
MSSANVFHATDKDFDDLVLKSDQPVLVDFWAPWCGPCKMIAPSLDQLADTYEGKAKVVKVDIEANPQLGMRFNVRSIPMLVMFKGGQIAATQMGAPPNVKSVLSQMIDRAVA